jgi:AcrR family transcriptional regulator
MQAVAAHLGVDRKALNYHVGDREGLLSMVAFEIFETEFSKARLSFGGQWQDVTRSYARALRQAAAKLGPFTQSVRLRGTQGLASLADVEVMLEMLNAAGFDTVHSRRILVAISDIALADVLDIELIARNEAHPQVADLLSVIKDADHESFPVLQQVVADRQAHPHDDGQFDFHLEAFIAGLEHLLKKTPASPRSQATRTTSKAPRRAGDRVGR